MKHRMEPEEARDFALAHAEMREGQRKLNVAHEVARKRLDLPPGVNLRIDLDECVLDDGAPPPATAPTTTPATTQSAP